MVWDFSDSNSTPNPSDKVANIQETKRRPDLIDKYYETTESGNDQSKSKDNELNNWIPANKYKRIKIS